MANILIKLLIVVLLGVSCNRKAQVLAEKIHLAVAKNHSLTVKELLADGVDINIRYGDVGDTPLLLAIKKKHLSTVKILLEKNAQLDLQDNAGMTALLVAVEHNDNELAAVLLSKGANPNIANTLGETALVKAVEAGNRQMLLLLLKNDADVLVKNKVGKDLLTIAQDRIFQELIPLLETAKSQALSLKKSHKKRDQIKQQLLLVAAEIQRQDVLPEDAKKKMAALLGQGKAQQATLAEVLSIKTQMNDFLQESVRRQQHGESNREYFQRINHGLNMKASGIEKRPPLQELMSFNDLLKQSAAYKNFTKKIKLKLEKSIADVAWNIQVNSSADLILNFQKIHYFEDGKSDLSAQLKELLRRLFPLFSSALGVGKGRLSDIYAKIEILAGDRYGDEKLAAQRARKIYNFLFQDKQEDFIHKFAMLPLMRVGSLPQKSTNNRIILRFDFIFHAPAESQQWRRVPASLRGD